MTALIIAAWNDDHRIVAALLGARADVNTKQNSGCAFAAARSARVGGGRWCPDAAVPAPSGRWTALHFAARNGRIRAAAELLVGGAEQRITNNNG
jgi:ankyrin repeat protein